MIELRVQKRLAATGRRGTDFVLDVDFACASRRLVLFGHSGSGKSLTMQMLAGLVRPDAGRIRVDGVTLYDSEQETDIPARQRRIGYMFQDYALFPHLTVRQNVAFPLECAERPCRGRLLPRLFRSGKDHTQAVTDVLDRLEVGHLADRLPRELSGGQRQRVALSRALVAAPRALLLDEPFAALDPLLRVRMRREIRSLLEEWSIPVVLITHDPDDVDAFADTLVVYDNGRVARVVDAYRSDSRENTLTFLTSLTGGRAGGRLAQSA